MYGLFVRLFCFMLSFWPDFAGTNFKSLFSVKQTLHAVTVLSELLMIFGFNPSSF